MARTRRVTDVWFDADDPFLGDRSYPKRFCTGCGVVNVDLPSQMRHETNCAEPIYRPVACHACATENWKRDRCRCCGKPIV